LYMRAILETELINNNKKKFWKAYYKNFYRYNTTAEGALKIKLKKHCAAGYQIYPNSRI
jgi:hypothetical protein